MPKIKKDNNRTDSTYPQGISTCPICGKEFKATDNTRFIICGGYTCSWKCFSNEIKKREAAKKKENKR